MFKETFYLEVFAVYIFVILAICWPNFSVIGRRIWASQVVVVVKSPPPNAGDTRDMGLIPGSRRSPREGNGNPHQDSCLEQSMGSQRVRHHWVTKCIHTHIHKHNRVKIILIYFSFFSAILGTKVPCKSNPPNRKHSILGKYSLLLNCMVVV